MNTRKSIAIFVLVLGLVITSDASAEWTGRTNPDGTVTWTDSVTGAQMTCDAEMTTCRLTRARQF